MGGSRVVPVLVAAVAACGHPVSPHLGGDGGVDAPDAPVDASAYAVALGSATIVANTLAPQPVSITGPAGVDVVLGFDRASAGAVPSIAITLDATGAATAIYTPCMDVSPDCLGTATITVATAAAPATIVATYPFTLIAPAEVGEVAPCQTTDNVLYLHGNDALTATGFRAPAAETWSVQAYPDQLELDLGAWPFDYRAKFSLLNLQQPIAPGVYEHAQRIEFAAAGHPGIEVNWGCNIIDGRFDVYDYTADPVLGTLYSATISFEQVCDGKYVRVGCVHYQTPPPPPPATPPPPDPTKVYVQVLSATNDVHTPDPSAWAIFSDSKGVVLDTQLDAFGIAQASLPTGGSVTTFQYANNHEYLHTYRGVKNGDQIVINAAGPQSGATDMMLATVVPPTDSNHVPAVSALTLFGCNDGSWSNLGPLNPYLKFHDGCRKPTFEMLTIAGFADTTQPSQFNWQTGLAHQANGNVQITGTWAPMGTATVTLANIPSSQQPLGASWSLSIDGYVAPLGSAQLPAPVSGTATLTMADAPGAGDAVVVDVGSPTYGPAFQGDAWRIFRAGTPTAITLDLSSQPIPLVSLVQPTRSGVSWTQTTGGTADVRRVVWAGTYTKGRAIWEMFEADDGRSSTTLPSLPRTHAADDPTADRNVQLYGAGVSYTDYDVVTGFTLAPPSSDYQMHESFVQSATMAAPF